MVNSQFQITNLKPKRKLKVIVILVFILCFGFYLLRFKNVLAESHILINEFLIDPQPQQVEIYNNSSEQADISGWIIDDSGGTTFYTIPQSSILYPNSCLVFSADYNLNKSSSDVIRLFNGSQLIDSFPYKSSSGSGVSYMRLPDASQNWSTGPANLGKINSQPEQSCILPSITYTPVPTTINPTTSLETNETPLTITPSPILYKNIYISEVMVNPEPDNHEWVEIYNNNDFPVNLKNWFIDDIENAGSTPKSFNLDIQNKNYAVIDFTSSIFNNESDSVRLLDFNKNTVDDFEYESSNQGRSYGRLSLDVNDFCQQTPTYNLVNIGCLNPSPTQTAEKNNVQSLVEGINKTATPYLDMTSEKNIYTITNPKAKSIPREKNILGAAVKNSNSNQPLVNFLCRISICYSLLTIISLLIKMKILYGKIKVLLSSFIYTGGT